MSPLFEVRGLRRDVADRTILTNITFSLDSGQILFVRGPSGVGKSLLLRALASLDHPQAGTLLLHGRSPAQVGYPSWRTAVSYVSQARPSSLRGTPAELYFEAQRFTAQRARPRGDLPSLVHALGLEQAVLHQQWGELSGGQAQRVALALSVALGPQVLLLDEPTSACDPLSALRVERVLASCGAALVWVTHDPNQPARVGGRMLELPLGNVIHLAPPPLQPPVPYPLAAADGGFGAVNQMVPGGGMGMGTANGGAPGVAVESLPRAASLLLQGEGDGGYLEEMMSDDQPLSPPSPAQLRGAGGVP